MTSIWPVASSAGRLRVCRPKPAADLHHDIHE
jgi:hypothetical protein